MLDALTRFVETYGYLAIAVILGFGSAGLPLPGETLLLVAGAYAASGHLSLGAVIAVATVAVILGDAAGYWVGRRFGRPVVERFGPWLRLDARRMRRIEAFFARHGPKAVFFGRFASGLQTYGALVAGMSRMPYPVFTLYNVLGGIVWAVTYSTLGYLFGHNLPLVERWVGRAVLLLAGILLLVLLAALFWRWASRHEVDMRARWAAVFTHPRVAQLRTRLAPQIAFLRARFSPAGYLGLQLTVGLALILLGGWMFGDVAEAVFRPDRNDPIVQLDQAVSQFLHAHAEPPFTAAMEMISLAGYQGIIVASLVLAGYLAWRRRWSHLGPLTLVVGGGALVNLLLKTLFARHRPIFADPLVILTDSSFPSGHAMGSLIFYGLMARASQFFNEGAPCNDRVTCSEPLAPRKVKAMRSPTSFSFCTTLPLGPKRAIMYGNLLSCPRPPASAPAWHGIPPPASTRSVEPE